MTGLLQDLRNGNYVNAFKSRKLRLILSFLPVFATILVLIISNAGDIYFSIWGGIIGTISSLIVMVSFFLNPKCRGPPYPLLYWRTFCDLGLALRFTSVTGFNQLLCGFAYHCTRQVADEGKCPVPSAIYEFFAISSECWFLCNGVDLYYSVTNPFSSFRARMVWYHYFSWTVSLLFSIPPLISSHYEGFKVFGFFYVNKHDEDANAFCWINLPGDFLTWPIWVLFFVPLIVIYIICVIILNFSYAKLKKGISRTFLPRMKLLVTNTVNMLSQLLYWFIVALFYIMTSVSVGSSHGSMLNKVLLFIIATKGFSSLFVWIIVGEHSYESKLEQEQTVDANQALREEVLQFATGGIRSAGRDGSKVTSDRKFIKRVPQKTNGNPTTKRMITPYFFMRFLLGLEEESKAIEDMVSCNRRSVNDSFDSQTLKREKFSIGTERLSQRATVPTGNRLTAFRGTIEEGGGGGDEDDDRFSTDSVRPSQLIDIEVQAALDKENKTDSTNATLIAKIWSFFMGQLVDASEAVEFTEYEPYHFRRIRYSVGISDRKYVDYFSTTIKERLTQGGASGAFFFFSKDEKFIAKSCSEEELQTLSENAEKYANYLVSHPDSFITKIYGAYRLKIYGTSLHFFVMSNIFLNDENLLMNEKYDIKGSCVKRNAEPPLNGQSVTCTHCEQKFIYKKKRKATKKLIKPSRDSHNSANPIDRLPLVLASTDGINIKNFETISPMLARTVSSDTVNAADESLPDPNSCPYTVDGVHEPNVILKDNDLKYKIRLPLPTAAQVLRQLCLDADFFCSLGIMDYSLLVGVHNTEYEVLNTEEDGPVLKKVGSSSHNMQSVPFAIAESKDLSPILIGKESLANRSSSYHIKPDQRTTFVETPSSVSLRSNYDRKEEWEIEVESQGTSLVRSSSTTEADTLSTTTDTNDVKPSKVNASTPAAAWADSTLSSMSGSDDKSTRPASVQGIELSDMRTESSSVGGGPRQGAAPHRGSAGSVRGSTSKRDSKLKDISATRKLEVLRVVGPDAYFMGIIDFQQKWNIKKRIERFVKVQIKGADPDGLSAVAPDKYRDRFLRKIEDIIDFEGINRSISVESDV